MDWILSKRSILGTILLMILIGEPTVGSKTGLFTPIGFVLFFFLYLSLFHLFDSLIYKYKMTMFQVILLTFSIYSVFVTGFLNKELTEYLLNPNPFITLIRIQASFFAAFSFYLLNRIIPRNENKAISPVKSSILFTVSILILSLSGTWGIQSIAFTFKTVPFISMFFILLALMALYFAFKAYPKSTVHNDRKFLIIVYLCILFGAIPSLFTFVLLLAFMIIGGTYVLLNKNLRYYAL